MIIMIEYLYPVEFSNFDTFGNLVPHLSGNSGYNRQRSPLLQQFNKLSPSEIAWDTYPQLFLTGGKVQKISMSN